jgi:hypothetical protein
MTVRYAICYTAKQETEAYCEHIIMWATGEEHQDGDPIFGHRSSSAATYQYRDEAERDAEIMRDRYRASPLSALIFVAPIEV